MNEFLNQVSGSKVNRFAVTAILVLLALFLLVTTLSVSKNMGRSGNPATELITVSGEGQASMKPDIAHITFTVQHRAGTVAAAQDAATKQSNDVIAYVKEAGVKEDDIKTLSYNINPEYSYPNPCSPGMVCPAYTGSPRITGYQVSETVQVTVRDLAKVGDLLSGLGQRGVQNVSGPDFALDDATSGYSAARKDAIEKAKKQADELAAQLGVRLGKIVSYSENSPSYPYPMSYGMGGVARDAAENKAAPTIQTGQNTYTASVTITYEIR
jgi:uncharacterized protein